MPSSRVAVSLRAAFRSSARTEGREATPEVSSTVRRSDTHARAFRARSLHRPAGRRPSASARPPCGRAGFGSGDRAPLGPFRRRPLTVGARRLGSACPPDGPQPLGSPFRTGRSASSRFLRSIRPRARCAAELRRVMPGGLAICKQKRTTASNFFYPMVVHSFSRRCRNDLEIGRSGPSTEVIEIELS